jgi:hypothetical protein
MTTSAVHSAPGAGFAQLLPGPHDRAVFVGQTGSGKTTLAHLVLEQRPYVVAYDPKGYLNWPGWKRFTSLHALASVLGHDPDRHPHAIYRPSYAELSDERTVNAFFEWVYKREHTTVYVDELSAISSGDVYPWYFGANLTRGRERGISVFCATQRPARIPQIVLSESEHVYIYRLKLPRDRQRVAEMCGVDESVIAALRGYEFLYAPQSGDVSGPYVIDLSTRRG